MDHDLIGSCLLGFGVKYRAIIFDDFDKWTLDRYERLETRKIAEHWNWSVVERGQPGAVMNLRGHYRDNGDAGIVNKVPPVLRSYR